MANEPIRRPEFERHADEVARRFGRLEDWQKDHDDEHDQDAEARAHEAKEDGKWTVTRTIAVITAAGMLIGLWLQALALRR